MSGAVLVFFLMLGADARAAAPNVMTYQGRLKAAGVPVTGPKAVEIRLCPDPGLEAGCVTTGAQGVQVTNGLFRSTFTVPSAVALEGGPWYLEVKVDNSAFTPRERLLSSPYAVYASSAATLLANPNSEGVLISTNVQISGRVLVSGGGHVLLTGGLPTADCGAVAGSDGAGRITVAGTPAACTLTFGSSWGANAPVCHFNNETQVQFLAVTGSNAASVGFTTGGPLMGAGDSVSYLCVGY